MSRVRADTYTNREGTGAPIFTSGIIVSNGGLNVSGVVTATSFKGDGTGLTGVSAGIATSRAYTFSILFGS